jgi:hypothetical protein
LTVSSSHTITAILFNEGYGNVPYKSSKVIDYIVGLDVTKTLTPSNQITVVVDDDIPSFDVTIEDSPPIAKCKHFCKGKQG